jgi:hypothetical protein
VADCTHNPPCPDFAAHRARQLADWKTAQARHNRQLRNRRGKRPIVGYQAGMNIISVRPEQPDGTTKGTP